MPDPISFDHDIRALIRESDIKAMRFAMDLSSYDDVRTNADAIYERIADGTMPCDIAWSEEKLATLRQWIDTGMNP